ncbi:hypothetical protein K439DRAFT_1613840 [Ramaria rubella]|nr:hypothetical protein K439DRAFT_1613840 [Ramaria rubella]
MPTAPLAKAHLAQYTIKSSDALAEMRVNVLEEGTDNVRWYKERTMTEDEIVESVVDSTTSSLRWSIHRPKRGWYLRLRSPVFPVGTFIPLIPPTPPPADTKPVIRVVAPEPEGALTFAVRTAPVAPEKASPGEVRIDIGVHSYPPTPPAATSPSSSQTVSVPSPHEINAKLSAITTSTVTRFILYPSIPITTPAATSPSSSPIALFSRALSYFTLPSLPIRSTTSFMLAPASSDDVIIPLLTFTERTSTFSVNTTGLLEINKGMERQMGVEPAFWIAVALAYLDFLTERDLQAGDRAVMIVYCGYLWIVRFATSYHQSILSLAHIAVLF